MITYFKIFERQKISSYDIEIGDIVINLQKKVGLVVSNKYTDKEFNIDCFDVYYRMSNGDIYSEEVGDIELATDYEMEDHIWAYVSIAKKQNKIINITYEYSDSFPNEYNAMLKREKTEEFNI